jgi:hypothetical protein
MANDVDEFLAHYGVEGMRWGVRKAEEKIQGAVNRVKDKKAAAKELYKKNAAAAKAAGYTAKKRRVDFENMDLNSVRRIENRIANGESVGKARTKEYALGTAKGLAIGAGILAAAFGPAIAKRNLIGLATSVQARRGAKAAADLFANSKGLTSYSTVALNFDKVRGVWA